MVAAGHTSGVGGTGRVEFEGFERVTRPDSGRQRPDLHSIFCILHRNGRDRGRSGGYFWLRADALYADYKTKPHDRLVVIPGDENTRENGKTLSTSC